MTLSEYAQNIANLIRSRPEKMDYHRLMYRIYVLSEIAEGERAFENGQWRTQEEMEGLWRTKGSKSAGAGSQNGDSKRLSNKSKKTHR